MTLRSTPGLFGILLFGLLPACASDADDASEQAAPVVAATEPGTVRGTIAYAGDKRGTVKFALFRSFPPSGPPVASGYLPASSFPIAYELPTPAGRFTFVCFLDVTNDGTRPTADDVSAPPVEVEIPAGDVAELDVQLPE